MLCAGPGAGRGADVDKRGMGCLENSMGVTGEGMTYSPKGKSWCTSPEGPKPKWFGAQRGGGMT